MIYRKQNITTPIIPSTVQYYTLPAEAALDYKAICCFAAIGFFLDDETYFTNQKAFRPATNYCFDEAGNVSEQNKYFEWHYSPRDISFEQALDEFAHLFEKIVERDTKDKKVILPISGGLDSRTLAVALQHNKNVFGYSYQFKNGFAENEIAKKVADACNIPYQGFEITNGYLWNEIEAVANLNQCYSDFLNPRQVAVLPELKNKGNVFLLGHWGDVLFDSMGIDSRASFEEQCHVLKKKLIKRGGAELAEKLWQYWGLTETFQKYFDQKISFLLNQFKIDDANARIRAFKSTHWVPRWTATNLCFFNDVHPIQVPYFDDEMCRWICTVPEEFLANRKLQIAYIKMKSPKAAAVPWQSFYPCNLNDFKNFNSPLTKIRRGIIKGKRILSNSLANQKQISRNWELQFLGKENEMKLIAHLHTASFKELLPESIPNYFLNKFNGQPVEYAHSVSMLLTLSEFARINPLSLKATFQNT